MALCSSLLSIPFSSHSISNGASLITDPLIMQRARGNLTCSIADVCSWRSHCRTLTSVFIISHKSRSASYEGDTFLLSSGSSCTLFLKFKTRPLASEVKKYTLLKNLELNLYSRSIPPTTLRLLINYAHDVTTQLGNYSNHILIYWNSHAHQEEVFRVCLHNSRESSMWLPKAVFSRCVLPSSWDLN